MIHRKLKKKKHLLCCHGNVQKPLHIFCNLSVIGTEYGIPHTLSYVLIKQSFSNWNHIWTIWICERTSIKANYNEEIHVMAKTVTDKERLRYSPQWFDYNSANIQSSKRKWHKLSLEMDSSGILRKIKFKNLHVFIKLYQFDTRQLCC